MPSLRQLGAIALGCLLVSWGAAAALVAQKAPPRPAGTAQGQDAATSSASQAEAESKSYIRVERDADGNAVALQTATGRFVSASGEGDLVVDLVSVVHIADEGYYRVLNKQFEQYDVVLYELVAEKGTRIPQGGRDVSDNPWAMLHEMTSSMLGLSAQTDHIDYTKTNFVHADMSPDEIAAAMEARGDDAMTLSLSIAADLLRQANLEARKQANAPPNTAADDFDPFSLLLDAEGPLKLKRMMAEQFAAMDDPGAGLGQTLNTLLIKDRNAAALREFQQQLAAGKKRIAIFYGAGHMADFEERLVKDFGLRRDKMTWDTAWDLKAGSGEDPLLKLMRMLDQMDK